MFSNKRIKFSSKNGNTQNEYRHHRSRQYYQTKAYYEFQSDYKVPIEHCLYRYARGAVNRIEIQQSLCKYMYLERYYKKRKQHRRIQYTERIEIVYSLYLLYEDKRNIVALIQSLFLCLLEKGELRETGGYLFSFLF